MQVTQLRTRDVSPFRFTEIMFLLRWAFVQPCCQKFPHDCSGNWMLYLSEKKSNSEENYCQRKRNPNTWKIAIVCLWFGVFLVNLYYWRFFFFFFFVCGCHIHKPLWFDPQEHIYFLWWCSVRIPVLGGSSQLHSEFETSLSFVRL